jgi:hypothetical protein
MNVVSIIEGVPVSQFSSNRPVRVLRSLAAMMCAAGLLSAGAAAQTPAAGNSVKVGKFTKLASGVVTDITNGDAACYISLKDDQGQMFDESGDFSICEKPKNYVGKRVSLSYEIGQVMSAECEGNPKCKETTTLALVTAMKVIDTKAAAATGAKPVASAVKAAPSLCTEDENVIFACSTGSKFVSVCEAKKATRTTGHLQYRFGKLESTEPLDLTLPEAYVPANKAATGEHMPFSGGAGAFLRFDKGAFSYVVYTGVGRWGPKGETREKAGVVVERSGKLASSLKCKGEVQSELGPEWMEKRAIKLKPNDEFTFPD